MAEKKEYPILWWTPWFGDYDRYNNLMVDNCGLEYKCRHTLNRTIYDQAKLIVFHESVIKIPGFSHEGDLPPLQDIDSGDKAWVYQTAERPQWLSHNKYWISRFTFSWTHHFGSDFIDTYFTTGHESHRAFINLAIRPVLSTLAQKNLYRIHGHSIYDSRPLAPVAWFVSNCKATNGRHLMVRQLQRYIDVDIYGGCRYNRNRDWPVDANGQGLTDVAVASRYKFYLAIENTNCDDYVTEKLERAVASGAVPVVDGPRDYSRFNPAPKALIRYDDFGSPKALAEYLVKLDQDDEAYNDHLAYRAPRTTENTDADGNVRILEPATFNQEYKTRLLPWFVDNWDLQDGFMNQTSEWLSEDRRVTGRSHTRMQWGPNAAGALCDLCRTARNIAEGDFKIDPVRRMTVDHTCETGKFLHPTWVMAFYWYYFLAGFVGLCLLAYVVMARKGHTVTIDSTNWLLTQFQEKEEEDEPLLRRGRLPQTQNRQLSRSLTQRTRSLLLRQEENNEEEQLEQPPSTSNRAKKPKDAIQKSMADNMNRLIEVSLRGLELGTGVKAERAGFEDG
ncbi:Alpha-(1,3)-fucosyltransferase 11 [Mortierella alpina]|nr:Alpha-(1,3)-fucosyltransferase 11 [Mortierella alpina]